jgi:hypothetical protein
MKVNSSFLHKPPLPQTSPACGPHAKYTPVSTKGSGLWNKVIRNIILTATEATVTKAAA